MIKLKGFEKPPLFRWILGKWFLIHSYNKVNGMQRKFGLNHEYDIINMIAFSDWFGLVN